MSAFPPGKSVSASMQRSPQVLAVEAFGHRDPQMGQRGRCDIDVLGLIRPHPVCAVPTVGAEHTGHDERLALLPRTTTMPTLIEMTMIGSHHHQPLLACEAGPAPDALDQPAQSLILASDSLLVLRTDARGMRNLIGLPQV